jgi:hypothetical protein
MIYVLGELLLTLTLDLDGVTEVAGLALDLNAIV